MDAKQVILCYGDDFAAAKAGREYVDAFVPEADQVFGLETIEARVDTVADAVTAVDRAIEALRTVGFMGKRKAVWLRDASFLSDTAVGKSDAVKDRLAALAGLFKGGLAPEQMLVITAVAADQRFAFFKACKAVGTLREFALPKKDFEIAKYARAAAAQAFRAAGLQAEDEVLEAFADKVGPDLRQIANETEKLSIAVGGRGRVTAERVETLTCSSRDIPAWDLADAVGEGDAGKAIKVLRRLLFQRRNPIGLVIGLENRARDLLLYREAIDHGWLKAGGFAADRRWHWGNLPDEVAQAFADRLAADPRKTHPYRTGILARQASGFTRPHLAMCFEAALSAHEKLVSSAVPAAVILEVLVLRMSAGRDPRAAG